MPLTLAGSGTITGLSATQQGLGLTLITAQSFTAASSVSIDNCFTSTYDNYRIVLSGATASSTVGGLLRFRVAGADNTTTNYKYALNYVTFAAASGIGANGAISSIDIGALSTTESAGCWDILGPNRPAATHVLGINRSHDGTANIGGMFALSTAFDGFTIYPASGTITGTLSVYGYTN